MKKNYVAPKAEVIAFAKEDVITGSEPFEWELPEIDIGGGGDWNFSENANVFNFQ